MRGEFIGVWSELWREVWQPLLEEPLDDDGVGLPEEFFSDLYRLLALPSDSKKQLPTVLAKPPEEGTIADILSSWELSRDAFVAVGSDGLASEPLVVRFLESVHELIEEYETDGGDSISNRYFNLLSAFIEKFSLRYDLCRPCLLSLSLPRLVTSLVQHINSTTQSDAHLAKLRHELEDAIRDLRHGRTETRIKTCLSRQYILVEGIANVRGGTTGETLGQRCNHASWPHPSLKSAAGSIYGFRCDYPGLGHAGNPSAVLREVDDRELVGLACMLLGVVPYVDPTLSVGSLYGDDAAPPPRVLTQPGLSASTASGLRRGRLH